MTPRTMTRAAVAGVLPLALLLGAAAPAAAEEPVRWPRLWIEAGPSFDRDASDADDPNGYALAGGIDIGRAFAFTMQAAFEHYPGSGDPELVSLVTPSGPVTLRREGGGNKVVVGFAPGLRIAIPARRCVPFVDASMGMASVASDFPQYLDPATGAVFYPSSRREWSGLLSDVGLGVWSRRRKSIDFLLGVRWRYYGQLAEGDSGSSFLVRFGIVKGLDER